MLDPFLETQLAACCEGDLVEVTFTRPGIARGIWKSVVVFLEHRRNRFADCLVVSYRPLSGTATIETSSVLNVEHVVRAAERRGRRGDHRVRLPYRDRTAV